MSAETDSTPTFVEETVHDEETQTSTTRIIFISLDHSTHSQYAFDWALENFLRPESDLVVLANVRPVTSIPATYGLGTPYIDFSDFVTNIDEQQRNNSHALLQKFAAQLRGRKFSVKAIALRGDARDEIVRKAKEVKADALIMGSRGLGVLKRTILGSVSDYCSHHAHCTVVIVKKADESE